MSPTTRNAKRWQDYLPVASLAMALFGPCFAWVVTSRLVEERVNRLEVQDRRQDERLDMHDKIFSEQGAVLARLDERSKAILDWVRKK